MTSSPIGPNDVAIVGIALRFPGSHGPREYWTNLRAGRESVRAFTDEELLARGVSRAILRDPAYVKSGVELSGMDQFDPEFFGFSPKEAAILDPQHRHFLECSWEALEDAGHPPETFRGPIGVFGGCGMGSYFAFNLLTNRSLVDSVGLFLLRHTGNDKDFLATRVSYCLDLTGPSINVQTACSTSLVAVHLACQSLLGGECDLALAGGVTIEIPHGVGYMFREGEILSPDGHCRAFDHRSQGTIFGSGVGIVALRRLEDAIADGDRIYAVVKGSAVNNDGAGKVGYLAPSVDGQAAAVAEALEIAGVDADTVEYIEAHGTGTPIGDPIEVAALSQAFGRSTKRKGFCGLGSVKANIGHLDTAAGVASLIKAALSLHHGEIPPTPNFESPNPAIPFAETPFYVLDRLRPWPRRDRPRRAGVNSLGVGGTNAHVILEEAPVPAAVTAPRSREQVLCISARSKRALDEAARRLASHLRENPREELADVAYSLFTGRRAFEHRRVLASRDGLEAAALLDSSDPQRVYTHASGSSPASVVFLFPGGGAQHPRMACDLYDSNPAFREQVDRGVDEFHRRTGRDLRATWLSPADPARAAIQLEQPSLQLPAIFILEHALARLWASLGVEPAALIGHSLGENTAACIAGVFSFEDALGLVALRGELFERLPDGGMLSIPLPPEEISSWLGSDLDLATINSPSISVVSGRTAAVEDLARRLAERGVEARRIPITTAAHSRLVEPILPRFGEYLRSIRLSAPKIPFVSNSTGTWITPEQAVRPEYWVEHLRNTVRFSEGIRTLLGNPEGSETPERVFLEVGPGKTLSSLVKQHPGGISARGVIASMRHAEEKISDSVHFLTALGRLWASGVRVDPKAIWAGEVRARVPLPTYPFQHRSYWIEPGKIAEAQADSATEPRPVDLLEEGFYRPVWKPKALAAEPALKRPCTWLLFLDPGGFGERLARRLRARGDKVVTVRESDDNRRLGEGEYALSPERGREGYDFLVRDLVASGSLPQRIVHLWMLTPDESFRPGSSFFHRNQERGFYSLFFLAQVLGDEGATGPLHIAVLGNAIQAFDDEKLLYPDKATIVGPCKVIPREFPGVTCSMVDLPLQVSTSRRNGRSWRGVDLEPLVGLAEAEVLSEPGSCVVAYREGLRYEQAFERTALGPPAGGNGKPSLRERGVYLVTGGLGGIGLVVALHLARSARAKIVLVGRSSLPPRGEWDEWLRRRGKNDPTRRRIRAIREIESAGGEVFVACADVTNIEAMQGVIAETVRRFGALHGVIHAAGVMRDSPLLSKTPEEVEDVFAPKVHGALVLDAALQDIELDFLVLFSSVSAIVAPPGQVDYVAANAFLDAFAASKSARTRSRVVAVNWGIWNEVGMAADALQGALAPPSGAVAERIPQHPLFDYRGGDPDVPLVLTAKFGPETHWILGEHRTLKGQALVPGTAYLEMAHAALAEAGEASAFEIRDVLFLRPLHVPDGSSREVRVELRPDPKGYEFSVQSREDGREQVGAAAGSAAWVTHAQAKLHQYTPTQPAQVPLDEIEARCPVRRSDPGSAALPSMQEHRLRFGPRWRSLREVRLGSGEVLATLELQREFLGDLDSYGLHPALLDIAMTCGLELPELTAEAAEDRGLWVPISYKCVRVHAPLPPRVRSWAKIRQTNPAGAGMVLFDVVLLGADGRVCVEIEEFAMRRVTFDLDLGSQGPTRAGGSESSREKNAEQAQAASPARAALQRNFELGIRPAEGMEALDRILRAGGLSRVVATSLDLEGLRLQADALSTSPEATDAAFARPELDSEFVEPRDGIERTLAGFWQELLGLQSVGVRDSFFDLGGHSLIAVRLFARIKKAYQVEFPISLLFEAPTIERCAEAIRRATGVDEGGSTVPAEPQESRYTHLVPMHPGQGGEKTPFFLVAGMFGNVLNLRHLAHLLGNERRFFGLQARGLYGTHSPHENFEETARDYLAEVRRVQPSGPYLLGGFSGGGITAYEMALQLLEAGEEVALLGMLDTPLPQSPRLSANEKVRIHWERIRRKGPAYVTEWARDKWRYEMSRIRKRREQSSKVAMSSEFRSEEIAAAFRRALERYPLRPYPGEIHIFRPRLEVAHVLGPGRMTNAEREFLFHDNGWGPHVGRVEVHEVAGDHDSMVLEPNVRVLAASLRACIQGVESGSTRSALSAGRHVGNP